MKKRNWVDNLPSDVYTRLCNCRSLKSDIETLVNVKWAAMVLDGKKEQGFIKEDALAQVLDLLDANGQFFDLQWCEYDALRCSE